MSEKRARLVVEIVDKATAQLSKLRESVKGFTDIFFAARAAVTAFNATFGQAIAFLKDSLAQFGEQERALRRLEAALRNQGFHTKAYVDQLKGLADQMQRTTEFTDEAVLESMRLFTAFGIGGDLMGKATKAAADLASGLDIDLRTATMMVGKAYEGNTQMLSRYVGELNKAAPASDRLEQAASRITRKFGADAQAKVSGYSGAVIQTRKAYDELKETIGGYAAGPVTKGLNVLERILEGANRSLGGAQMPVRHIIRQYDESGVLRETEGKGPGSKPTVDPEEMARKAARGLDIIAAAFNAEAAAYEHAARQTMALAAKADEANRIVDQAVIGMTKAVGQAIGEVLMGAQVNWREALKSLILMVIDAAMQITTVWIALSSMVTASLFSGPGAAIATLAALAILRGVVTAAFAAKPKSVSGQDVSAISTKVQGSGGSTGPFNAAEGLTVLPRAGGTLIRAGEAGGAEAVVPLDDPRTARKLAAAVGGGGGVTIQAGVVIADDYSLELFAKKLDEKLYRLQRRRGTSSII